MFKLNKICAISGNADHQCCSLVTNQSINKVNLSEPNYYTNTENWINSDGKSINYSQNPSPQLITQFNKCSLLPLIQAQVNNHTVCAIVYSGATRSLVSSDMATEGLVSILTGTTPSQSIMQDQDQPSSQEDDDEGSDLEVD